MHFPLPPLPPARWVAPVGGVQRGVSRTPEVRDNRPSVDVFLRHLFLLFSRGAVRRQNEELNALTPSGGGQCYHPLALWTPSATQLSPQAHTGTHAHTHQTHTHAHTHTHTHPPKPPDHHASSACLLVADGNRERVCVCVCVCVSVCG